MCTFGSQRCGAINQERLRNGASGARRRLQGNLTYSISYARADAVSSKFFTKEGQIEQHVHSRKTSVYKCVYPPCIKENGPPRAQTNLSARTAAVAPALGARLGDF